MDCEKRMTTISGSSAPIHPEISALLPWYVNGRIGERERRRVDAHLTECAHCREELAREQWVYRNMNAETPLEYMPAVSLNRLQARLDGIDVANSERSPEGEAAVAAAERPRRRSMPWQGLMAASVAVIAVALGLLAADRWMQYRARAAMSAAAPAYYTVTTAVPRAPDEAIRAVFSPAITLSELQGILDEAQLRIVSGPSEAGVYSLAANSRRPVSSSLALLRSHAQVRFAESTAVPATPARTTP
jgi:Putative zinc-finger